MISSNILGIDYNAIEKKLKVTFMGMGKVEYSDVPYNTYDEFFKSKSKGSFYNENIKGKFEEKKLL